MSDEELIKENQEILRIQQETLKNLEKYNKERNTEIVDDRNIASVEEVAELQNEVSQAISSPKLTLVEREESFTSEDPSEYKRVKMVPYVEADEIGDDVAEPEWVDVEIELIDEDKLEISGEPGYAIGPEEAMIELSALLQEEEQYVPQICICEFCGSVAHQGQIHGLGYCKEKIQYEQ